MVEATSLGIKKLIEDIEFCFVVPILTLCFGFANSRLRWNRRDSAFRIRLVLTLAILLFLFAICTVIVQDRIILVGLWQESPVFWSLVYSIGNILGLLGIGALIYWKLRPKLWR
jgi:hypothetical protein